MFPLRFRKISRRVLICRVALSLILISASTLSAQSQKNAGGKGTITGSVVDSLTQQSIEYATIRLLSESGQNLIDGTVTNSAGIFQLNRVADGNYKLVIDFLGYKQNTRLTSVDQEGPQTDAGIISMVPDQTLLQEIVVSSERNIIENRIDKIVYNATADLTSQSGVATDILKKVPQVSVDIDGNVQLQGSGSVRFLINGRPSVLFANSPAEALQSIPASQIQSIEVITIPGAKYDATGTGGIINIILKKNKDAGTNGSMSLSVGTRLENISLNLNLRKKNFGVNAFFSGNAQVNSTRLNNSNRSSQDSTANTQLIQDGQGSFTRQGFQTGLGFDWDPTAKDNFQGTVAYNNFGNNTSGYSDRDFISTDDFGNMISDRKDAILTINNFSGQSIDTQFGYKRKFDKEDRELEIGYNSSFGKNSSFYEQSQENLDPENIYSGSRGNNPGIENATFFYLNYTDPFTENIQIEMGAKTEVNNIVSHSNVYQLNTMSDQYAFNENQSSSLDYKREIYAGYFSSTFKVSKRFVLKAGMRYEYTTSTADFSSVGKVIFNPYHIIVPSVVLMNTFGEEKVLKLSYTRRIERPNYGDLNPFINASDPRNVTTGNPNLKPEIGDRMELSYSRPIAKDGSLVVTLFARNNSNDIQPYTRFYNSYIFGDSTYYDVSVRTRENIGHENNYGIDLFASMPVTKRLKVRVSLQGFERYIYSGISSIANVHGSNLRTNMNVTYTVNKSLTAELFGNFRSKMTNAQGTRPSFTSYVLALRKQFMHKQASVAFTATNFISKYVRQETYVRGDNFTLNDVRQIPYRSFGINLTYKFGGFRKEDGDNGSLQGPPEN